MAALVAEVHPKCGEGLVATFLLTMQREWHSIDRLRLDKFMLLCRKMLRAAFQHLARRRWDPDAVETLADAVRRHALFGSAKHPAIGFALHLADSFLPELAALPTKVPAAALDALVAPFAEALAAHNTGSVLTRIREDFLETLADGRFGEDGESPGPFAAFDAAKLASHLFEVGAAPETSARNRAVLYDASRFLKKAAALKKPLGSARGGFRGADVDEDDEDEPMEPAAPAGRIEALARAARDDGGGASVAWPKGRNPFADEIIPGNSKNKAKNKKIAAKRAEAKAAAKAAAAGANGASGPELPAAAAPADPGPVSDLHARFDEVSGAASGAAGKKKRKAAAVAAAADAAAAVEPVSAKKKKAKASKAAKEAKASPVTPTPERAEAEPTPSKRVKWDIAGISTKKIKGQPKGPPSVNEHLASTPTRSSLRKESAYGASPPPSKGTGSGKKAVGSGRPGSASARRALAAPSPAQGASGTPRSAPRPRAVDFFDA